MSLQLKRISLPLANFTLEVDVEIRSRVTVLFGPSGAGKTSLLDLIAGLRRAPSALIRLGEQTLTDTERGVFVPARSRGIGYVPQDLALFPHLSVRKNLLYGHTASGGPFTLEHVAEVLEIPKLLERRIPELSGGEKQRVALARALLASPRLLLLDEPLASLDQPLKARILPYLARVRDEFGVPMIYVTHDRFEALALAEEMVVLANGAVAQTGSAPEVFSRPASLAVAGILAIETVEPGRITGIRDGLASVSAGRTTLYSSATEHLPEGALDVYVSIRAEDVILLKGEMGPSSPRNHLSAFVRGIQRAGPMMRIDLDCGFPLAALLTKQACEEMTLKEGDTVIALVKAPHVHLIPR